MDFNGFAELRELIHQYYFAQFYDRKICDEYKLIVRLKIVFVCLFVHLADINVYYIVARAVDTTHITMVDKMKCNALKMDELCMKLW